MTYARVIGAGLSGLTAAWWLTERDVRVEVIDAAAESGGLIATRLTPYGLVETAANAFRWTPTARAWFARLGIAPCFPRRAARRRYIWRDGRPRRWPLGPGESAGLAARLGLTWTRRAFEPREGERMDAWGARVAGGPATRWLIGPALQGIFAAAPAELSAAAVLGYRSGGRRTMATPADGMGEFIGRLHDALERRGVRFLLGRRVETLDPDVPTVVCTGARGAGPLVAPHAPELAAAIDDVRVRSLLSVTAFFDRHPADLSGFGVLFPAGSGIVARGVLFNDEIFEGRGSRRSETWIYSVERGALDRAAADNDALVAADRERLTGRRATPLATYPQPRPDALPIYDEPVLRVRACLGRRPGWLALAGNYLGRLGVAGLLDTAAEAVGRLAASQGRAEVSRRPEP